MIHSSLGFSDTGLSWVQNAYTLAFGGLLLLGARSGEILVVTREDAGAASGLVNGAHQLGGSLGLGILVAVFAAAGSAAIPPTQLLAVRVGASLTAGTVMLGLAFVIVMGLIVWPGIVRQDTDLPGNLNHLERYR